jgi:hypothetical protein
MASKRHCDFEGDAFEASFTITDDVKPSVITIRQKPEGRQLMSGDREHISVSIHSIDELIELLQALRPQLDPDYQPKDPNVVTMYTKKVKVANA